MYEIFGSYSEVQNGALEQLKNDTYRILNLMQTWLQKHNLSINCSTKHDRNSCDLDDWTVFLLSNKLIDWFTISIQIKNFPS